MRADGVQKITLDQFLEKECADCCHWGEVLIVSHGSRQYLPTEAYDATSLPLTITLYQDNPVAQPKGLPPVGTLDEPDDGKNATLNSLPLMPWTTTACK